MRTRNLVFVAALTVAGCDASKSTAHPEPTMLKMDFERTDGFYDSPFPSDDRLLPNGAADVSGFPNRSNNAIVRQALGLIAAGTDKFSQTSHILMSFTGSIETTMPTVRETTLETSPIQLIAVSGDVTRALPRHPCLVEFNEDGGPFGTSNLLSVLPYPGVPLRPDTTYALVVRKTLLDNMGSQLGVPSELRSILAGEAPTGMSPAVLTSYQDAITTLESRGIPRDQLAGLTVFTTGNPARRLAAARADASEHLPIVPEKAFTQTQIFTNYCVYESTVQLPSYQRGEPPFASRGGDWVYDDTGHLMLQREETSRVIVTIPRTKAPTMGFPVVVLVRTGAGGDRPLVERGVQDADHEPLADGTGPAQEFAAVGYAGVSVDGPLGGLRNPEQDDEQFLIFNITNPAALRDNVRQSGLELALLGASLSDWHIDAADCPGVGETMPKEGLVFDTRNVVLMGHSTGASIAPLAAALEPSYRTVLLSGAGASYVNQVLYKEKPLQVKGILEGLLGYSATRRSITANDPVLMVVQWGVEDSDAQVYARQLIYEPADGAVPRNVLMMQGIVDHYIMPPIANAATLSLGIDAAEGPLDEQTEEIADLPHVRDVLWLSGRSVLTSDVSSNIHIEGHDPVTGVLVQYAEDGIQDGHEVVFQNEAPKEHYRCFLQTLRNSRTAVFTRNSCP